MKILFTGGASGGHFYPIIAVIDALDTLTAERKLLDVTKYYMAASPYDKKLLFDRLVHYKRTPAGKMRAYFSPLNFLDMFKTAIGVVKAIGDMYVIFPDVVFGKGGHDSIPALLAARFFGIPVVIHESDAVPGSANRWAGRFARSIALGFPEAAQYFVHEKVAYTGNPVRKELHEPQRSGGREFFKMEDDIPVIVAFGGSQGSEAINERILDALPELLNRYYVIHQTGARNFTETEHVSRIVLEGHEFKHRYHPVPFFDDLGMKMAGGVGDVFIARAGASTIAELALWGAPAIIVPLPSSKHDHQRENAYAYARTGAAVVSEQANLTATVLVAQVDRLIEDTAKREAMSRKAKEFSKPEAAKTIAEELLRIALEHE
jgi:UDP-N-acetylglucosamine--N-acetylmuramyl-(pentapeptide) pyrophosphoryl-undecaprenol N-acetylglucosamine transferase